MRAVRHGQDRCSPATAPPGGGRWERSALDRTVGQLLYKAAVISRQRDIVLAAATRCGYAIVLTWRRRSSRDRSPGGSPGPQASATGLAGCCSLERLRKLATTGTPRAARFAQRPCGPPRGERGTGNSKGAEWCGRFGAAVNRGATASAALGLRTVGVADG